MRLPTLLVAASLIGGSCTGAPAAVPWDGPLAEMDGGPADHQEHQDRFEAGLDAIAEAGSDGPDGAGGDGGASSCSGDGQPRRVVLLDPAGNRPPPSPREIGTATVSFKATVTVIEACEAAACTDGWLTGFRIGLAEENGTRWNLFAAFPGVALDVLVGDVLEITSKGDTRSNSLYFVTQHATVVTRNGELVMFEDRGQGLFETAGVTIEASNVRCQYQDIIASGLRVGFEGQTAVATPAQPVQLGSLQFTYYPAREAIIGMIPVSHGYLGVRLPR